MDSKQYIIFTLDDEHYALTVLKIREIIGYKSLTRLPDMPGFILGVIDIRGEAVPVVNIRDKFNLPETGYDNFSVVIILELGAKPVGFIVDNVSDVLDIKDSDIQAAPNVSEQERKSISGVVKYENKFVLIVDVDQIVSKSEMSFF